MVSGAIGGIYTINSGASFQPSLGEGVSQNCEPMDTDGTAYGCAGSDDFGAVNGLAISRDSGISFKAMNISALTTIARYGKAGDTATSLVGVLPCLHDTHGHR